MAQAPKGHGAAFFGIAVAIVLLGVVAAAWVRNGRWQSLEITDAGRPADLVLHAKPRENVSGLAVSIAGKIDGSAELSGKGRGREALSGHVDLHTDGDWFRDECRLHYEPHGTKSGTLTVKYRFH